MWLWFVSMSKKTQLKWLKDKGQVFLEHWPVKINLFFRVGEEQKWRDTMKLTKKEMKRLLKKIAVPYAFFHIKKRITFWQSIVYFKIKWLLLLKTFSIMIADFPLLCAGWNAIYKHSCPFSFLRCSERSTKDCRERERERRGFDGLNFNVLCVVAVRKLCILPWQRDEEILIFYRTWEPEYIDCEAPPHNPLVPTTVI